jgi:hypothetical protein
MGQRINLTLLLFCLGTSSIFGFGFGRPHFPDQPTHRRRLGGDHFNHFDRFDRFPRAIDLHRTDTIDEDTTASQLHIRAKHHRAFRADASSNFRINLEPAENGMNLIVTEKVPSLEQQQHLHPSSRAEIRGAFRKRLFLPADAVDADRIKGSHESFQAGEIITVTIPKKQIKQNVPVQHHERDNRHTHTQQQQEEQHGHRGTPSKRQKKTGREHQGKSNQGTRRSHSNANTRGKQTREPSQFRHAQHRQHSNQHGDDQETEFHDDGIEVEEGDDSEDPSSQAAFGSIFSGFWDNRGEYHFWGDAEKIR